MKNNHAGRKTELIGQLFLDIPKALVSAVEMLVSANKARWEGQRYSTRWCNKTSFHLLFFCTRASLCRSWNNIINNNNTFVIGWRLLSLWLCR